MLFVLVVIVIVIAGWIYMAGSANGVAARNTTTGLDDYVPPNAYDNPYDTNENNDRPFEPDPASDDRCDVSSDSSSNDSCDASSDGATND